MGNLAELLPYSITLKPGVMKEEGKVSGNSFEKSGASASNVSSSEKQLLYGRIVEEFLEKPEQRLVIWLHLKYLLAQDKEGINWILEEVNKMIDEAGAMLLSRYQ
jgi:hypothetical protein